MHVVYSLLKKCKLNIMDFIFVKDLRRGFQKGFVKEHGQVTWAYLSTLLQKN